MGRGSAQAADAREGHAEDGADDAGHDDEQAHLAGLGLALRQGFGPRLRPREGDPPRERAGAMEDEIGLLAEPVAQGREERRLLGFAGGGERVIERLFLEQPARIGDGGGGGGENADEADEKKGGGEKAYSAAVDLLRHAGSPAAEGRGGCGAGAALGRVPAVRQAGRASSGRASGGGVPRVDHRNAAAREAADVSRDDIRTLGACDCGNHQIGRRGRQASHPSTREDGGIGRCRLGIERQHPAFKIFHEHAQSRSLKSGAATASGQYRDAGQDLGLTDCGGEQSFLGMPRHPRRHFRRRAGGHDGRQDVGIEDEHQSK
jgi:hypothetical protein